MLKTNKKRWDYIAFLYIMPWIIGFLVFQLYPIVSSFIYSFTEYPIIARPEFVGLDNYIKILTKDREFLNSLKVTFSYALFALPLKLGFALFVALILNMKLKFINGFRTMFYLPSILGSSVGIAIVWRFIFGYTGIINQILEVFNISPVEWIGNPDLAIYNIGLLTVWQFGSSMVLFLAGLKNIPQVYYEAAKIDGASKIRSFFNITLPLLSPIIFFNLIMQMINCLQEYTSAAIITNGGPMKSTYLYGMLLYDNAFKFFKMGYASALSWVLFAIILIFTFILFKKSSMWVHYGDGGDF
ncbi:carbohydrate ABC transporter permease [Vallitalea okinawensis]|uniref:carbohydrate ABC transporter permease n=1 Tax=Vallitalea okinawensis TaxID=2078660 RepID=UPI000CFD587B|nr:sugar ABC transporter permease [Vallitalea okinawensis]